MSNAKMQMINADARWWCKTGESRLVADANICVILFSLALSFRTWETNAFAKMMKLIDIEIFKSDSNMFRTESIEGHKHNVLC